MSAWLSNLLTVPHCALYAHDILSFPDMMQILRETGYPNLGVVDTAAGLDNMPDDAELSVIDSDPAVIAGRCRKWLGDDTERVVEELHGRMEALKPHAAVYHADERDEWIAGLFEAHTGLPMDWSRYHLLGNLNIQSQLAHRLSGDG